MSVRPALTQHSRALRSAKEGIERNDGGLEDGGRRTRSDGAAQRALALVAGLQRWTARGRMVGHGGIGHGRVGALVTCCERHGARSRAARLSPVPDAVCGSTPPILIQGRPHFRSFMAPANCSPHSSPALCPTGQVRCFIISPLGQRRLGNLETTGLEFIPFVCRLQRLKRTLAPCAANCYLSRSSFHPRAKPLVVTAVRDAERSSAPAL